MIVDTNYDALVLVHPGFTRPINPDYDRNIVEYVKSFREKSKPIFFFPDPAIETGISYKPSGQLEEAVKDLIPLDADHLTDAAHLISLMIRKNPSETKLAFGGTDAHLCVYSIVASLCHTVVTKHPGKFKEKPIPMPIAFGYVLDDIV